VLRKGACSKPSRAAFHEADLDPDAGEEEEEDYGAEADVPPLLPQADD
jgi:hypothetical protein